MVDNINRMFITELKKFSQENWWVYMMLIIILLIVYSTGKGNILEIVLLFLANFLANIFVMVAIGNYSIKRNKIGAIYHFLSSTGFLLIGLYGVLFHADFQYFIFQLSFMLAAIKAVSFYTFEKDLSFINEFTMSLLNIILMGIFIYYFSPIFSAVLLGIGFSVVTIGLVSTKDIFRYFMNMFGSFIIISASGIIVYQSFSNGNLDGIGLGFLLLTLTALAYFIKLLPSYIVKLKK